MSQFIVSNESTLVETNLLEPTLVKGDLLEPTLVGTNLVGTDSVESCLDKSTGISKEICCICLDNFGDKDYSITKCGHYIDTSCLCKSIIISKKSECSICRQQLYEDAPEPKKARQGSPLISETTSSGSVSSFSQPILIPNQGASLILSRNTVQISDRYWYTQIAYINDLVNRSNNLSDEFSLENI